nr:MAG TPA_asm: hypothetical protein [Caudoviricetes sp.]
MERTLSLEFFYFFTHFHDTRCNSLIINLPAVPQQK